MIVVSLQFDQRRYQITGLQANWEVTLTLKGSTAAGDGVSSSPVVGGKKFPLVSCFYSCELYTIQSIRMLGTQEL